MSTNTEQPPSDSAERLEAMRGGDDSRTKSHALLAVECADLLAKPNNLKSMNQIIETLVELWRYDLDVFSRPWIYWCLCIPAAAYLGFFFIKWTVITAPLWLPFVIIIRSIKGK